MCVQMYGLNAGIMV